jgi:hypothetical protein
MSVDRSKAPQFSLPTEFALPAPQQFKLGSGSIVFYFPTPGIDAVKLEVIGNSSRTLLTNSQSLIPPRSSWQNSLITMERRYIQL